MLDPHPRWSFTRACVVAAAVSLSAAALPAQTTLVLQGTIRADGDVPIEGARVTVTSRETGEVKNGGSAAKGAYVVLGLSPGPYTVRVQKLGYAPAEREIRLLVGQRATLDFVLQQSAVGLREVRVHLNPYDAEFTRGGSYIISAVTQRGTNETQGSVFGYLQNNGLRALNYSELATRTRTPTAFARTPYDRAQVGVNLRGPVVHDKLFYSFSYELNDTKDAIGVVPGRPAYKPGVWDQFAGSFSAPTKNHTGVLRLTAPLGQKHTLDAIYAGRYYDSETNFGGTASRDAGIAAKYWINSAQLRDTYQPTSSLVNQFSLHLLTWNHNESPLVPGITRSYPSIAFGTNTFPLILLERHYRAVDKMTWSIPGGKHVLEGGAELSRVATSSFLPSNK